MLTVAPPRLTFLEYGSLLAFIASGRATCPRGRVGCVLFNSVNRRVAATGYNGCPVGQPHCDDVGCLMVDDHCSRTVHAERSACNTLDGRKLPEGFAFVTIRPCKHCFDVLVDAGITNIFYMKEYDNKDDSEYIEKVCKEKRIIFQKLPYNPIELLKKVLEFHGGQGGLFLGEMPFEIIQKEKEVIE